MSKIRDAKHAGNGAPRRPLVAERGARRLSVVLGPSASALERAAAGARVLRGTREMIRGGLALMMRGANPAAVQRILRHSDPKITTEVYGHLAPGYLRAEVDRLSFGLPSQEAAPEKARQTANSGSFVTPLLPAAGGEVHSPPTAGAFPEPLTLLAMERDSGFEPPTFSLGT